jgi:hypothetical protein
MVKRSNRSVNASTQATKDAAAERAVANAETIDKATEATTGADIAGGDAAKKALKSEPKGL